MLSNTHKCHLVCVNKVIWRFIAEVNDARTTAAAVPGNQLLVVAPLVGRTDG